MSRQLQEVPPPGGFRVVNVRRAIPYRGPGPFALLGAAAVAIGYGLYKVGEGNQERR